MSEEPNENFEELIDEARQILARLAQPELPLHEGVALYKEGMNKIRLAGKMLDDAKLEIETFDAIGEGGQ